MALSLFPLNVLWVNLGLVLSDSKALALVYQFVYWALRRNAVDINVPLIEASIGPMLSMDIMISNVGCETPYTEDALEITRMDWATLFVHLREYCGVVNCCWQFFFILNLV